MEWAGRWRREGAVSRGRGIDGRARTSGEEEVRDFPDLIITPPFALRLLPSSKNHRWSTYYFLLPTKSVSTGGSTTGKKKMFDGSEISDNRSNTG
jgi:hypothetical protein